MDWAWMFLGGLPPSHPRGSFM